jgi:hypothetical protein
VVVQVQEVAEDLTVRDCQVLQEEKVEVLCNLSQHPTH